MVDVLLNGELELFYPELMELKVHLVWVGIMMGDSLEPAVP